MGGEASLYQPVASLGGDEVDVSRLFLETRTRIPRLGHTQIERPGLCSRIADAIKQKSVVILNAPAGYGKTATLAKIARMQINAVSFFWVSLGEEDTISTLLSMAYIALDPVDVPWKISRIALINLATSTEAGPLTAADAVAMALQATDIPQGVVVFDDLHNVRDPAVFRALERLTERLPKNWTLVLSSRQEPPLSLTRLRLQGSLAEFKSKDLAFTVEEFSLLAHRTQNDIQRDDVERAWRKVVGWPAGCELMLQAGLGRALASNHDRAIFELLSREILSALPQALQRFLMQCSILHELHSESCLAVSGDPRSLRYLRDIRSRGLFVVELQAEPPVLRLHDLFRDFLRSRLREESDAAEIAELYRRASSTEYVAERRIGFLLQAGDLKAADEELSNVATNLLLKGDVQRIKEIAGLFPADYRASSPDLAFLEGLCCDHDFSKVHRTMKQAGEIYAESGNLERSRQAQTLELLAHFGPSVPADVQLRLTELKQGADAGTVALCALVQYLLARTSGTTETELMYFDEMLAALELSRDPLIWNICAMHIYLGLQQGMAARAERYATATLSIASDGYDTLRDSASTMRAWHYLHTGEYEKASSLLTEIEAGQRWNGKPYAARGGVKIARSLAVFFCQPPDSLKESAAAFLAIFDGREGTPWVYWRGLTHIFFGRLFAAQGNWAAVRQHLASLERELHILNAPYLKLGHAYLEIQLKLSGDEADIPASLIEQISQRPLTGDYLGLETALDAARSLWHARNRNYQQAWGILDTMLDRLTADVGALPLNLLGPKMLKTLAAIPSPQKDYDAQRGMLIKLASNLQDVRNRASEEGHTRPEGLTVREIEILAHMERGDSNKLIARRLGLSPHTIKRHVANILEKLQVSSRGQASAWYRANLPTHF